jgi:hypothetical protein
MPLLRKTGIRAPWMPSPLDSGAAPPSDMLRPVVVIGALVPMLLLGGITKTVSGPRPLPENTDPRRPTIVQVGQQPVPGAIVWKPEAARLPNTDPLRPTLAQWPPVPVPGAIVWKPEAARLPNTDPLRPLIVAQDPPDATLALPSATWTGRLPRAEDTTRPARPAIVVGVPVPVPGAIVWEPAPSHETPGVQPDRVQQELAQVLRGQQPIPGALAQWTSRPAPPEDVQWPARPATVKVGQVPVPSAVLWAPTPAHETPGAQPDRVAQEAAIVLRGQQPVPGASALVVGRITQTPTDPIRPAAVVVGQQPIPGARVAWVGVAHDGDRLRATGPHTWAPPPPVPGPSVLRVGAALQQPLFTAVFTTGTIIGPGQAAGGSGAGSGAFVAGSAPGSTASSGGAGEVAGASDDGEVAS